MLKVLWLSHNPLPFYADAIGASKAISGGWLVALADALVNSGNVYLAVVSDVAGADWNHMSLGGIENYTVPTPRERHPLLRPTKDMVHYYKQVVREFNPDAIHIHGTEAFFGLLTADGHLDRPTVISIQGIINHHRRHLLGGISIFDILKTRTLRDWLLFDGLFEQRLRWDSRAAMERRIFAGNYAFIGRTLWDRAHLRRLNPKAHYYHCDEMIRQPFHDGQWDISRIKRHSIFASSASYPLKGFHILVKAAAILRREFPDITIRTPLAGFYPELSGLKRFWKNRRSMGYARYLTDLIRKEGLGKQIIPLPGLNAEDMAGQLLQAHVFVLPSLIENSPNSLAEAMLVGTPAVASFVGGVQSMTQDGKSTLFFPPGDEAVLAEQIRRVFLDDELAIRLSRAGRKTAWLRHSPEPIVQRMINIYKSVIQGDTPESLELPLEGNCAL